MHHFHKNEIRFGRYSDNNKGKEQGDRWKDAEGFYSQKKYFESIRAFFYYLKDTSHDNVLHVQEENGGTFIFYQGSKKITGHYNETMLEAEVSLAAMPQPSVPVMRRLLELNFALYYTRYGLHGEVLCMRFDSDLKSVGPGKLYYGLKELATTGDSQDDLLLQDFTTLLPIRKDHLLSIPEEKKEIKYKYFQKWITETLNEIAVLDHHNNATGVGYLLGCLIFRIDYLLVPEGKLKQDIERILSIHLKKAESTQIEQNDQIIEEIRRLESKIRIEILDDFVQAKYTFATASPPTDQNIKETIQSTLQNYQYQKQFGITEPVIEYGLLYCQHQFSLPQAIRDLVLLFMMVNHADYFQEMGFSNWLFNNEITFDKEAINTTIEKITESWMWKYPLLKLKTDNLKWESLLTFNLSFAQEIEALNLEKKQD
jgi:hypothetical protein